MTREDWLVQVVVHATKDEIVAINDRMTGAICVPPDHEGRCETPWFAVNTPVADLDDADERRHWSELLDDQR